MEISSQSERQIREFIGSQQWSDCTQKSYTYALHIFFRWFEMNSKRRGKLPERKNIIAFKAFMKDKKKLSPNTLDLYHTSLKIFFQWLIANGKMTTNPMDHLKRDQKSKDFLIGYLDHNQSRQLLASFDQTKNNELRDYAMVVIMLTMGLRRIEIVRMNISDVENHRIKIQPKGQNFKNRILELSDLSYEAINNYISFRGSGTSRTPLFISLSNRAKNQRISPGYISQMVKSHLLTIGINNPKFSCHSLRHTCAYSILAQTKDENIVQAQLGHSSINTTHRYTHGLEIEINKGKALQAINEIW
jgi:site-specific recombinase XerD